jgi:hypothetical protein
MAQRKPILQLKADCDPVEFIQVKLTQTYAGGRPVKRDAPTMDGASIEAVLYCIREFEEFASDLDFDTIDEVFSNFVAFYVERQKTNGIPSVIQFKIALQ